jgi:glycosyltransferase involved in cell wall biosynthesis
LRHTLGLSPDQPVAAIVAALRPEKNHELFLRAAARIARRRPEARFLVIGDGPRRSELERLTAELEIEKNVLFLGVRSDVPRMLSLASVLVLSSHMEANPVSILEALACGKPVVATRVGSIAESVEHGICGYLVTPGDEAELAARVDELLGQPELACRMGQVGRERVVRDWSLERMVEGYQELIERVYTAKCPGSPEARAPRESATLAMSGPLSLTGRL